MCTICSQILAIILQTIENNLDFPEITHDFTKITHGITKLSLDVTKITHDVIPKFSRKFSYNAVKYFSPVFIGNFKAKQFFNWNYSQRMKIYALRLSKTKKYQEKLIKTEVLQIKTCFSLFAIVFICF